MAMDGHLTVAAAPDVETLAGADGWVSRRMAVGGPGWMAAAVAAAPDASTLARAGGWVSRWMAAGGRATGDAFMVMLGAMCVWYINA